MPSKMGFILRGYLAIYFPITCLNRLKILTHLFKVNMNLACSFSCKILEILRGGARNFGGETKQKKVINILKSLITYLSFKKF